jgi:acyl-CoA synthetase (AMP-forming)/AMP-acid ligase II
MSRAAHLALHLHRCLQSSASGKGSPARVGVLLRNCAEVLEAHYAIAAIRAVCVNVNTNLAPPELAHVLSDSGTAVLIADVEFEAAVRSALLSAADSGVPARVTHILWTDIRRAQRIVPLDRSPDMPGGVTCSWLEGDHLVWWQFFCTLPDQLFPQALA